MESRLFDLTRELTRARHQVDHCLRGLARFNHEAYEADPRTERIRAKLEADSRLTEIDAGYAMLAFADATSPDEAQAAM